MMNDFLKNPDRYLRFQSKMSRQQDKVDYGCAVQVYKRPFYAASYTLVCCFILVCLLVGLIFGA